MKTTFRIICVSLLVLCAAHLRAETITHDFNALFNSGKLELKSPYTAGSIGDTVYTCSGDKAKFGYENYHTGLDRLISIILPKNEAVTTTPVIEDLVRVTVKYYTTASYESSSLKLYISEDGSFDGDPIPESRSSRSPFSTNVGIDQEFEFPKGNYYIKLVNEPAFAYEVSIFQIEYKTDPSSCACLQVVSQ